MTSSPSWPPTASMMSVVSTRRREVTLRPGLTSSRCRVSRHQKTVPVLVPKARCVDRPATHVICCSLPREVRGGTLLRRCSRGAHSLSIISLGELTTFASLLQWSPPPQYHFSARAHYLSITAPRELTTSASLLLGSSLPQHHCSPGELTTSASLLLGSSLPQHHSSWGAHPLSITASPGGRARPPPTAS